MRSHLEIHWITS